MKLVWSIGLSIRRRSNKATVILQPTVHKAIELFTGDVVEVRSRPGLFGFLHDRVCSLRGNTDPNRNILHSTGLKFKKESQRHATRTAYGPGHRRRDSQYPTL